METLVEKIIDKLSERANEQGNSFARDQLEKAIQEIKILEEEAEFEEVARVMIKHLNNPLKYHPHHTVIINSTFAELSEGKESTGENNGLR